MTAAINELVDATEAVQIHMVDNVFCDHLLYERLVDALEAVGVPDVVRVANELCDSATLGYIASVLDDDDIPHDVHDRI